MTVTTPVPSQHVPMPAPPQLPGPPPVPVQWAPNPTPKPPAANRARPVASMYQVLATALAILSGALLGCAAYFVFGSALHHARAQHVAYANFRAELALATAPTGQFVPGHPKTLLTPGTPVAVLKIPALHVNEVVFEGTTGAVLENGPGHLRSTPLPGQAGTSEIMGRASLYGGPFRGLAQLRPGDTITVITGQGRNAYRVMDIRRAGDPQPEPLAPGAGRLMLATADGNVFAPSGVIRVDADLVSSAQPSAPLRLTGSQLTDAEQGMASDATAWYALVLWAQALLLAALGVAWANTRWRAWQTWLVAVPVIGYFGLGVADQAVRLLPNLM